MPTDFQLNSLRLLNRIFDPILWKYIIWFDGRTSSFCYMTNKKQILRWARLELFFVFHTSILWPAVALLNNILSSDPSLSLISAVCLGFYLTNGCLMFLIASSCYFFKADICTSQRDIIIEMSDPAMGKQNINLFY
jgi:hypothetical protein